MRHKLGLAYRSTGSEAIVRQNFRLWSTSNLIRALGSALGGTSPIATANRDNDVDYLQLHSAGNIVKAGFPIIGSNSLRFAREMGTCSVYEVENGV